jgi:hypothetical protein
MSISRIGIASYFRCGDQEVFLGQTLKRTESLFFTKHMNEHEATAATILEHHSGRGTLIDTDFARLACVSHCWHVKEPFLRQAARKEEESSSTS